MDSVTDLQIKLSQGLVWLFYFFRDNPSYAGLIGLIAIYLLWMFLKPEIESR